MGCPIEVAADPLQKPVKRGLSLVAASLELGRVLADQRKVTFRAHGTCMYPCIQPGDLLTIESRTIDQVLVGDIVVFRRNNTLFGHRAIAKGTRDGRPYVMTRPDRSSQGSDGPAYAEDVLGVFTAIKRHNKDVPLSPQPLYGTAAIHAAGWEWWTGKACPHLVKGISRIQRRIWYQRAASKLLEMMKRERKFLVRVSLRAHQTHDLYREFPAEQFVPDLPLWQGKPALRWLLTLYFTDDPIAAGTVTVAWHPAGCPRGEGWIIEELQIRTKYRGAGLDNALFEQARIILERSGMALQERSE